MAKKEYALAHTKWMCKYHIVFTPKYRRKIIYYQYKSDIRDIIKQLCAFKGVEIIEGHLMPDHVHILVSIPPKISVSSFMGYLKGIWLSTISKCNSSSSLSFFWLMAESSIPQDSTPIIALGGRLVMAIKVFPISSSGS